jgi:hypothetical protein
LSFFDLTKISCFFFSPSVSYLQSQCDVNPSPKSCTCEDDCEQFHEHDLQSRCSWSCSQCGNGNAHSHCQCGYFFGEEYCKLGRYTLENDWQDKKKHENEKCDCKIKAPYTFGSATALVCAHTPEAVQLLLARGAKANVWYTPAQHNQVLDPRTVLATHLVLRHGSDRDLIVRSLIQHGANVNAPSYPCFGRRQNEGWEHKLNNSPVCYWPSVVASGDVAWAKELIEKYDAKINWPRDRNCYDMSDEAFLKISLSQYGQNEAIDHFEDQKIFGLGATVLQIAIMSDNVSMVKMLLQKKFEDDWNDETIDVNQLEQVEFGWYTRDSENNGICFQHGERVRVKQWGKDEQCHVLSHAQRQHYWGVNSWKDINAKEQILGNKIAVQKNKRASSMSVALAVGNKVIIALLQDAGAISHEDNASTPVVYDWNLNSSKSNSSKCNSSSSSSSSSSGKIITGKN